LRIAVLMGGDSPERDISLASGRAVSGVLHQAGHDVVPVELARVSEACTLPVLRSVDIVFPALHGGPGEDGHLQAVLDLLGIPYALSGPVASALAMDKAQAKRVMRGAQVPTPDWLLVTWDRASGRSDAVRGPDVREGGYGQALTVDHVRQRAEAEIGFPLVIKPNGSGSSVAVEIVDNVAGFDAAFGRVVAAADTATADVLVERFIPGRELTAAIFLGRRLPLVEIRPRQGFYDYANKYTAGASEYLVPAPVHSPLYEQIAEDALRIHDLLGCRGMARVDFRLDESRVACLEVNTIPGLTEHSLVPKAAAAVGIGFAELIEDLCRDGLERTQRNATIRADARSSDPPPPTGAAAPEPGGGASNGPHPARTPRKGSS
jgi:D-alanine-D-alanine ligase